MGSGRVLVVEDDPSVGDMVTELLHSEGYEVVCALDDSGAYDALRDQGETFDALVLDIDLGEGTTGFDIARFGRSVKPEVGVIFISGRGGAASVARSEIRTVSFPVPRSR